MSPTLATLLTVFGVIALLRFDIRSEPRSQALWLPVLWLAITGSRFVSQWVNLGAGAGENYTDGSPVDAAYFLLLIGVACAVLLLRGVRLGELISNNKWLFALVVYGLVSIAWSDFPNIAFKRWIKTLGHPLMALIILTDPQPMAALRSVFRRCAYFLLPVSVLFIKYLPEYGRGFDNWTGQGFNNGIGLTKNDLGYVTMVMGIFFVWNLLILERRADGTPPLKEILLCAFFIWIDGWLMMMADSATSIATLGIAVITMLALGWRIVSKRFFVTFFVVILLVGWALESAFDIYAQVVGLLGRKASLTDRTVVWADVLALQQQPWFGYGFESFWLGQRLDVLWAKWWWKPIQAHNGYIETYLNLGWVGLVLLGGLILSTLRSISRQLLTDFDFARLRLAFLFAILAFNYTEAAFKGVHFVWTIFFIIAINCTRADLQSRAVAGYRPRGQGSARDAP